MENIRQGSTIRGPNWPEPVEVKLIEDMGEYVHLVGVTAHSRDSIDDGYSCIKPPKGALRELNDQSLHCSGMNDAIYVSLFCPLFMRLLLNLNQKQTNISLTKYTF